MEFLVSEWGFHTDFGNFDDAVKYCVDNELTDGEEGILWIHGKDKDELEKFIQENNVNFDFTAVKCIDKPHNWLWDNVNECWEDAIETEMAGAEDFEQKFEERKEYIEGRYGANHGKTFTK